MIRQNRQNPHKYVGRNNLLDKNTHFSSVAFENEKINLGRLLAYEKALSGLPTQTGTLDEVNA